jgi:hypothetical protein
MIKDTLKNAINLLGKKHNVDVKELRIRISKNKDDALKYDIMKNKEVIEQTNVASALNISSIVAFMVSNRLNSIMDSLIKEHKSNNINVRIYTKTDDCEPLAYLFDNKEPKCPLDIEQFI